MTLVRRAAIIAAHCLFALVMPVMAQDISLTSRDGSIRLDGTFLGYDGQFYRIDSPYGELTVDGSGVLCDGPACPNLTDFVAELSVSGAANMGGLLWPALVESYARRAGLVPVRETLDDLHYLMRLRDKDSGQDVARIHVRLTTTDEGFADLLVNEADFVLAQRAIRPQELSRATEVGLGDLSAGRQAQVIALDALVPIVSPGHPVTRINPDELARVFAGDIRDWSDLGGPDAPISLHVPDPRSGLGQAVVDRLLAPRGKRLAPSVITHARPKDLARTVEADPFAIGLASFADTGNAVPLALVGRCGFALRASRKTIKAEDYPLTAPLFLYRPARRLPKVGRDFMAYLGTPAAQQVVRRSGFVDQAPEQIGLDQQGDRLVNAITKAGAEIGLAELKEVVETLGTRRRLTSSFRFEAGASVLDPQSRSNVELLAQALGAGLYDARDVMFVGFSDGIGDAATNRRLSQSRAEVVLEAIRKTAEDSDLSQVTLSATGFGETMPMACDDSEWGREVNRRVEVWLRVGE